VRVISGKVRGLKLKSPEGEETRPTLDRVKEAVFSMLLPYLSDATVLDLFAGSGALGIEALSRGSKKAFFVDRSDKAIDCIKRNVADAGFENDAFVLKDNAETFLKNTKTKFDIVFLGDSIIGNYTDSMSVPEVVKTLTGARVYNCGYGGRSAALGEKDDLSVDMIAQAIVEEDIKGIPADTQVYAGLEAFFEREETDKKLMFVINYGLNDFFNGYPVQGSDAYDHYSYTGALRAGVTALKEAYPEAEVLLMTPNFTVYYDYGEAVQSAKGGTLKEYAEAVISLGEELDVKVLDNFHELPINRDNFEEYLSDGCHLNERGRFLLGSRISEQIK